MLAFIHIHKTGGTTVDWILRSSFGARHYEPRPPLPTPETPVWKAPLSPNGLRALLASDPDLVSIGGHSIQPHMELETVVPEMKYFTLVRDPLKMRASMYQHGVMAHGIENLPLEKWLAEDQSQNRQTKMIAGVADAGRALAMLREKEILTGMTERFDESMLLVRKLIAPELDIRYRRMRVANDNRLAKELLSDSRSREMLTEGNEEDIEFYRMIQEELYPEQCRRYGATLADDLQTFQSELARYGGERVSARLLQGTRLTKMAILLDPAPFNRWRLAQYLAKQQFGQPSYGQ